MKEWQGKRYWLVGASEGLGRALAQKLSAAGAEVIVSARNTERLDQLIAELPGKATAVTIDVTDRAAVEAAAAQIGPVDGVVYLAGVYWPIAADTWDAAQVDLMGEVNYLGAARVVGAVMPAMQARGTGHIVLTGSLSGFRGLPGAVGYAASKAGIMALAESLYADLRKTEIQVQLVNPGFIKTRLTEKNDFKMPFIMTPETAADEMFDHMNTDGFKKSFPLLFSWVFRGAQFLPDWAYYRLFGAK